MLQMLSKERRVVRPGIGERAVASEWTMTRVRWGKRQKRGCGEWNPRGGAPRGSPGRGMGIRKPPSPLAQEPAQLSRSAAGAAGQVTTADHRDSPRRISMRKDARACDVRATGGSEGSSSRKASAQ